MAMDLLLVRHGQTDWNPIGRVMGHLDIPINKTGVEQSEHLREWLKDVWLNAIYSSPIKRALQTAQIIAKGKNGLKVIEERGVAEIDYGEWVGITFEEVGQKFQREHENYRFFPSKMKIPGGERVRDVQKRAVAAIERIRKKHEGERVLVVSHADVIKAILVHYLGFPLDLLQKVGCDNGSLTVYRFGTNWGDRLVALNYFADINKIIP